MKNIPYGRHHVTQEDVQAVIEVLESDFLTQGPKVGEFEEAFAKYIGSKYALAVNNGTAALHLCTRALGVNPGDKVITSPITFAATANCVTYCGGEVVFVDIDPDTYLIDFDQIKALISSHPKGTFKGIIPIDFAGLAVDLEKIRELARQHDLWIIEDACHAPGGFFTDERGHSQTCGNGAFADLAIFSFHAVKHIATGEGGMITTNNSELYEKLKLLRSHGITKDPAMIQDYHGGWYYEMIDLGYNYRITDIQAALGISQLSRANDGLEKRRRIAERYCAAFKELNGIRLQSAETFRHAYHLFIIETDYREELYEHLREHKVFAQVHYIPVHLLPYYRDLGWKKGDFPNAESYYNGCLSLPIYPFLKDEEQDHVISTILEFYKAK